MTIEKVLVANRGEIAVRIIRACRELGLKTVAVYSTADSEALHTKLSDESICIGGPAPLESYLNIPALIAVAEATEANAIHPGYGFLSESAEFAEIGGSCGFTFIGPQVRHIRLMGDKAKARRMAEKAGVPTIPGDSKGFLEASEALEVAKSIGFPVLLKACAGGGGRGMKIVNNADDFTQAFNTATSEVKNAFGDGTLLVEKFLEKVRHVEVQVIGDRFANVVHIGTRDCSLQRRYQKVLEEALAPNLPSDLIEALEEASVKLAKSVNYSSLGTMEFLVDVKNNKFYFIEMNTRLQVEHPVTEMVSQIDLVKEQINVAMGKELSFEQKDVSFSGHAIELRINAEDPITRMPSPGTITSYHQPNGMGIRVESAMYQGYTIPPFYDSLIAKLIAYGKTREDCIKKLLVALDEYYIDGIKTNIDMYRKILTDKDFLDVNIYTKFLEEKNLA
ncbi:MAG: acetyl-CoA carboxylase biotin carboxylase subunit [Bdellovibrionota bacterium]